MLVHLLQLPKGDMNMWYKKIKKKFLKYAKYMSPPKLYLVDFSSEPTKWNKYICSFFRVQKLARLLLGFFLNFSYTTCSYPLGGVVINVLAW